jgi:hypothetical protein
VRRILLSAALAVSPTLAFAGGLPGLAAEYLARLRAKGWIRARVEIAAIDRPDDVSPGRSRYDFERGVCELGINERLTESGEFREEFFFKFMVYHELSHCELFAHPADLRFPGVGSTASRMISDLVQLDFLRMAGDEIRGKPNAYSLYQETYADVKAMGMLLAEGEPASSVERLLRHRRSTAVFAGDPHGTVRALADVQAVDWTRLDAEGIEREARAIADRRAAEAALAPLLCSTYAVKASEAIRSAVSAPFYAMTHLDAVGPDQRADFRLQLVAAASADNPVWSRWSELARPGGEQEAFVETFFKARYGKGSSELSSEDEEIRAALAAAR